MSNSGASYASLVRPNTFTGLATFNGGLISTAVGVTGALTTAGRIRAVVNVAAAHPVVATDDVVLADATGGAFPVTLPTAVGAAGRTVTVKKVDASVNAVTVASAGGTIDGAVSIAMATQNEALTATSDGANWKVIHQVATGIL